MPNKSSRPARFWPRVRSVLVLALLTLALVSTRAEVVEAAPDALAVNWQPRIRLEERGVAPFAVLTAEAWGNVAGGLEQRGWMNSLLDFGVELDTTQLGWWEGGKFLAQVFWVANSDSDGCFDDYVGGINPVSSVMAGDQLRVFNLHYRHSWHDDAVVLRLGQIAVDDDFMVSDYAGLFLNSVFGAMPSQVGTPLAASLGNPPAFPIFSVAAPGVFLSVRPTETTFTQLGLYYGRVGFDERGNHGFDWAEQSPAELALFWEGGCHYRLANRAATVRFGLSYHTGPVDDFDASTTGDPPATTQTVPTFYLVHDFQLLADEQGETKLGLFCRGGITPEHDRSMVPLYADAGLNWFAPRACRRNDVAGVAVSYTHLGDDFRRSTAPNGVAEEETTLEPTYKAQITHWMVLQVDTQFLFNPAVNPRSGSRETATVLGLRAEVTF